MVVPPWRKHQRSQHTRRRSMRKKPAGELRLRNTWRHMIHRCENPKDGSYPRYGGRGITVIPAWKDYEVFRTWAISAGYAMELTLDRTDNDAGYSPENCRWVSFAQQCTNRRSNRVFSAFSETKTVAEWSRDRRCVVAYPTLLARVKRGWDPEQALTRSLTDNNENATHCPSSHPYDKDNTAFTKEGHRRCKECHRVDSRTRAQKKRTKE